MLACLGAEFHPHAKRAVWHVSCRQGRVFPCEGLLLVGGYPPHPPFILPAHPTLCTEVRFDLGGRPPQAPPCICPPTRPFWPSPLPPFEAKDASPLLVRAIPLRHTEGRNALLNTAPWWASERYARPVGVMRYSWDNAPLVIVDAPHPPPLPRTLMQHTPAFLLAAPHSASGKSLVCLSLLAAYAARGVSVASVKVGPDYIDAAFHRAASGGGCVNLDGWGMRRETLERLAGFAGEGAELLVAEGVMGLFDGARDGRGSTADIAALTGWPVVLVVDGRGMGHSIGALAKGFADFREEVRVRGVILNRVASPLHRRLLEKGCVEAGLAVFGALPEEPGLRIPHRHLGLVQAGEHPDLPAVLELGAKLARKHLDLDGLLGLARSGSPSIGQGATGQGESGADAPFAPPAQHMAVARDAAFSFLYPHWLTAWRRAGATLSFFSPLADEPPHSQAGFVFLPGGYPELHAGRLAAASRFLAGVTAAAQRGAIIYGECGGYMMLGRSLQDAEGGTHAGAGLLPLESRFPARRTLGYRHMRVVADGFLGGKGAAFRGHEFHFAAEAPASGERPPPLFRLRPPSEGKHTPPLQAAGMRIGAVMGSFAHLIDRAPSESGGSAPCHGGGQGNAPSSSAPLGGTPALRG